MVNNKNGLSLNVSTHNMSIKSPDCEPNQDSAIPLDPKVLVVLNKESSISKKKKQITHKCLYIYIFVFFRE